MNYQILSAQHRGSKIFTPRYNLAFQNIGDIENSTVFWQSEGECGKNASHGQYEESDGFGLLNSNPKEDTEEMLQNSMG